MSVVLPKPQKFQATLASKIQVTKHVFLERFALTEPKEITFLPGQTVMLYVAPGINRSMSIASRPVEKNSILLVHDVAPMGPYSKWALEAKIGDPMSFMGPLGMFVVDRESTRNKVFVATGSGIAPYYAMIADSLGTGETTLYWGLRHEEDIFWQKQFEVLARQHPNFHFHLILSQPGDFWQGKKGHVQDFIFKDQHTYADSDYYLCGSRGMVDDMRTRLREASVPEPQMKFELFY